MAENLLEQAFRNMFDVPLAPDDLPQRQHEQDGVVFGYRERMNPRRTTSPEERVFDERRDLEDTFGIYEEPCTAYVHIRR